MPTSPVPDSLSADREVCRLVQRFVRRLDAHVREVAAAAGLTPTQVVALRELDDTITTGELAERMTCEPSNATFVADRLVERGLLARTAHERDRRVRLLELTAEGRRVRADVVERLAAGSPVEDLTASDRRSLVATLRALDGS